MYSFQPWHLPPISLVSNNIWCPSPSSEQKPAFSPTFPSFSFFQSFHGLHLITFFSLRTACSLLAPSSILLPPGHASSYQQIYCYTYVFNIFFTVVLPLSIIFKCVGDTINCLFTNSIFVFHTFHEKHYSILPSLLLLLTCYTHYIAFLLYDSFI